MTVTITTVTVDGKPKLRFQSPYHPDISPALSGLGGRWVRDDPDDKYWLLPISASLLARQVALDIYGIDPLADEPTELVDVRLMIGDMEFLSASWWTLGRQILSRSYKLELRTGLGVSIEGGGFESGSVPVIGMAAPGTVLVVRDVPRQAALDYQTAMPGQLEILPAEVREAVQVERAREAGHAFAKALRPLPAERQDMVIVELVERLREVRGEETV